jgi:hypothetical protein
MEWVMRSLRSFHLLFLLALGLVMLQALRPDPEQRPPAPMENLATGADDITALDAPPARR